MKSLFLSNLEEHRALFAGLESLNADVVEAGNVLSTSLRSGGKIMFCGNGGSAADCQHLAAEFTGRFILDRRPLSAMALSTDTSALTCIANDYAFDQVFARQVQALGRPGDSLVAISTSGKSENVIAAVEGSKRDRHPRYRPAWPRRRHTSRNVFGINRRAKPHHGTDTRSSHPHRSHAVRTGGRGLRSIRLECIPSLSCAITHSDASQST